MADDAEFTVIDPLSGKSPPPGFSACYATTIPKVHHGRRGQRELHHLAM